MQDIIDRINEKLGRFYQVEKQIATTNNSVFIVKSKYDELILKVYKSNEWPEDGKIMYVNNLLKKNAIEFPKCIDYDRTSFSKGYILEEKICGETPDIAVLSDAEIKLIYRELARYIKDVHKIAFSGFGYLNNGRPEYFTACEYFCSVLHENAKVLVEQNCISECEYLQATSGFEKNCNMLMSLPSVLCHGDLSLRNVIFNESEDKLTLIDWDDAMALPFVADICRLTFDMKLLHEKKHERYKKSFLDEYLEGSFINDYIRLEKTMHIFTAIDWLVFSVQNCSSKTAVNEMIVYLKELLEGEDK